MRTQLSSSNKKRNLNITFYACLLFGVTVFSSCEKDFLDIPPSDRFSEEAVWSDVNLINGFIGNTYRVIPSGFTYDQEGLSAVVDEASTNNIPVSEISWSGNLTPSNLNSLDYWVGDYWPNMSYWTPITRTNLFFENIEREREDEIDEDVKNRMIGEMKTIRAWSYFNLISLFGGVPLTTTTFSLKDNFRVPRNSYDEVMDFIISELNEAIPLLPLEYPDSEKGRITKGAAMSIKSRALLYRASPLNNPGNDQQKWQDAADAAKAVIDLGKYSLFPDYKTMFLEENIYNSEMIWQRPYNQYSSFEAVYTELSLYPNGYNGYGWVHPLHNLVEDYETINGLLPENDPDFDPQNPYVNRDPRFYASILYDGAPFLHREVETFHPGGLDSDEGPTGTWNATNTGYYQRKFANEKIVNPSGNNIAHTPWTRFRYAEILLNYAEAKYFLGDEVTAKEYINMVRSRPSVNMPDVTESGEALFDRIVNERRIELVFEDHRWFDVRRLMIFPEVREADRTRMLITKHPDGTKTYEVAFWKEGVYVPANYLLPIPQSEIDRNGALEQNPGYD